MKSSSLPSAKTSLRVGSGIGASLLRRAVLRQLGQLRHGHLRLIDGDDFLEFGDADASLRAEIRVLTAHSGAWSPATARSARARPISTATGVPPTSPR